MEKLFPPITEHHQQENRGAYQRRRAMEYNTWMDGTSLVGYNVKSPLSGHNYGYRARVKTWNKENEEKRYDPMFEKGLSWTLLGVLYVYLGWGWRTMLLVLGVPVAVTEVVSLKLNSDFEKLSPKDDKPKWQAEVQKMVDSGNTWWKQQAEWYGGDIQFLAGKKHHEYWVDGIPKAQGISLVFSATGAASLHRLLLRGGLKKGLGMVALGALAAGIPLYSITKWYLDDVKKSVDSGGSQTSHLAHGLGAALGTLTSFLA